MVFHHTNFVAETNIWWLRRVRPVWMVGVSALVFWMGYRYYMYQKLAAVWTHWTPEQEQQLRAQHNKRLSAIYRDFGFNSFYKPTLERSRKRQIMQA